MENFKANGKRRFLNTVEQESSQSTQADMSRVSILNYDEDYTCTRVATVTTTITKRSAGDFDNGRIKRARFQESTTKVIRNVAGQTEEITESSVSMENNFGDSCVTFGSSAELLAQSMKNAFNKMYQPNPLQICETDRFTDVTDLCASSAATANQPLSICDVIDLSDDPEEPKLDSPNDHKIDTEPPNVKPVALNRDPVVTQPSDPVGVNVLDKKYSCFLCQSVLSSKMDQANHLVSKKHQMFTNEMVQKGEISRCIFLDHLTPSCNKKDIEGKFNTFGKLQECKVFKRLYLGESITAAFVIFESKRSAEQAVKNLHHSVVMPGCKNLLIVMYDFSRNDLFNASNNVAKQTPGASSYEESSGKSPYQYFQSLPHNELQALMSEAIINPSISKPSSITAKNRLALADSKNTPRYSGENLKIRPGCELFIRNLPLNMTDDDLASQFQPFGAVICAQIFTDARTGASRGIGSVAYDNTRSANDAMFHMSGVVLGDGPLRIRPFHEVPPNRSYNGY